MGLPIAAAGAAIQGGASLLGNALNYFATQAINKKQQKWNEKMYQVQRQDSLADWNMQNAYNTPQAQMARFKEAGLNPHLIYGQGSDGSAATVRSSSVESWRPQTPSFDLSQVGSSLSTMYDLQMKSTQMDMLKTQMKVATQDALLKAAQTAQTASQTAKTNQDTKMGQFNLNQAEALNNYVLEKAQLEVSGMAQGNQIALSKNERDAALNKSSIALQAEAILKTKAETAKTNQERQNLLKIAQGIATDNRIKALDEKLKAVDLEYAKNGINRNDPIYMRMLNEVIQDLLKDIKPVILDKTVPGGWRKDIQDSLKKRNYLQNQGKQ